MLLIVPPTPTPTSPFPIKGPSAVSPDVKLVGGAFHTPWYCWTILSAWLPIVACAAKADCLCALAATVFCIGERATRTNNRQPSTSTRLRMCQRWLEVNIENLL